MLLHVLFSEIMDNSSSSFFDQDLTAANLENEFWDFDYEGNLTKKMQPMFNCTRNELHSVENKTEWSIVCNQTLCRPQEYYTANFRY